MKKIVTILMMGLMFSTPGFAAEAEIVTKIRNMIFTMVVAAFSFGKIQE